MDHTIKSINTVL